MVQVLKNGACRILVPPPPPAFPSSHLLDALIIIRLVLEAFQVLLKLLVQGPYPCALALGQAPAVVRHHGHTIAVDSCGLYAMLPHETKDWVACAMAHGTYIARHQSSQHFTLNICLSCSCWVHGRTFDAVNPCMHAGRTFDAVNPCMQAGRTFDAVNPCMLGAWAHL